jgi:hypothetical protein
VRETLAYCITSFLVLRRRTPTTISLQFVFLSVDLFSFFLSVASSWEEENRRGQGSTDHGRR